MLRRRYVGQARTIRAISETGSRHETISGTTSRPTQRPLSFVCAACVQAAVYRTRCRSRYGRCRRAAGEMPSATVRRHPPGGGGAGEVSGRAEDVAAASGRGLTDRKVWYTTGVGTHRVGVQRAAFTLLRVAVGQPRSSVMRQRRGTPIAPRQSSFCPCPFVMPQHARPAACAVLRPPAATAGWRGGERRQVAW